MSICKRGLLALLGVLCLFSLPGCGDISLESFLQPGIDELLHPPKLTQEQIDYLKSTYDLSDMSKQEYYDLMADLTNMNAISIDDVLSQYMKPMVPGVVVMSVSEGESMGGFGHMNHFGDIQGNLLQYMRDLNSMLERMANGQSSMDRNTFMAFRDYLEKEKDLSKRLEFIFDLIA